MHLYGGTEVMSRLHFCINAFISHARKYITWRNDSRFQGPSHLQDHVCVRQSLSKMLTQVFSEQLQKWEPHIGVTGRRLRNQNTSKPWAYIMYHTGRAEKLRHRETNTDKSETAF